ncbi:LOW QUALITY PROTEIN: steroid 21-hydroxylase-like [Lampetra planeri]
MELTWSALLLLLLLLFVLLLLLLNSGGRAASGRRSLGVPGPRGVPLLGNVAELFRTDRHRHLAQLARRHGPVYSLRLGAHEMVVLNSAEVLREALIKKSADFAGRPQTYTGCAISFGGRDLSLGDFTPAWRLQSRMARAGAPGSQRGHHPRGHRERGGLPVSRTPRSRGPPRGPHANPVDAHEQHRVHTQLRRQGTAPHPTRAPLFRSPPPTAPYSTARECVLESVCAELCTCGGVAFSACQYAEQDPEFRRLRESLDELVHLWGSSTIMARDHLPWLRRFPSATWTRFLEAVERRDHVVAGHLEAHKKGGARAGTEDITTSMLRFLKQEGRGEGAGETGGGGGEGGRGGRGGGGGAEGGGGGRRGGDGAGGAGSLTEQHLHMVLVDLLVGGSETTAITLVWAIAFLMHDPQLQERLHAELLGAVGRARAPLYADRFATPLLRATITEVLRTRPVAPLGIPHLTTRDTSVGGYQLPRGTTVIPNLWAAQHDPDKWSHPERFQPERHLHRDPSAERRRVGSLLPFGAGSRACLGASLARAELYILLALLIRDFRFEAEGGPGGGLPDLDGELTVILKPKPFHMRFIERP